MSGPRKEQPKLAKRVESPVSPPVAAIQAPWRMEYLDDMGNLPLSEQQPGGGESLDGSSSFLRDYWLSPGDDQKNHVIVRADHGLILLNRYPYAGGHLLVALGEARPRLLDYTPEQRARLWGLTELAADLMERTLRPQGINFGINQGRASGAGVPQHLHVHLVPRWQGDVNFMAVVGNVRVIPASLEKMAERYRKTKR